METQNDTGPAASAPAPTKSKRGRARGTGIWSPTVVDGTGGQRGHYLLLRELHTSIKSQVFLAHDSQLDRTVALKCLAPGRRDNVRHATMLRNEARLLANFNHTNIVNLYSVEEDADGPFLAMEYLNGVTLAARLREGNLSPATAAEIFTQILNAVDSIHRHGIVHSDLAPDNLLLMQDGTVKVLDFGSARIEAYADGGNDEPDLDSLLYFAPERLHSSVRDMSGDLYSVGVVLYQSLCGMPPAHDDGMRTFEQRLGALSTPLRAVVLRATAAEPSQRFRSAVEFRNALNDAVAPLPLLTPAVTGSARAMPAMLSSIGLAWVRNIRGLHLDIALVSVLLAFLFALGLTPKSSRSAPDISGEVPEPPVASAVIAAKPAAKKVDAAKSPPSSPVPGDRYRSLRKAWGTE